MAYDYTTGAGVMSGTGYPDLPDPSDQKKIEDILETVGLHPAQVHVQGVLAGGAPQPAQPVEAAAKPTLISTGPAAPAASTTEAAPVVRIPSPISAAVPPGMPSSSSSGLPMIRTPQEQNAIDQTEGSQKEYKRLIDTGSGISQIKNPFLKTLARIGDVAGTALFPGITAAIPGTELHHDILLGQSQREINQGLGEQEKLAQSGEQQARAEELIHPKPQLEMTDQGLVRVPQEGEAAPVTMGGAALKKPEPTQKPESVAQLYADAVQDAVARDVKPEDDPKVQQYADAITSLQRQPEEKAADRDYQQWLKDNKLTDSSANKLKYDGILAAAKQAPQRAPQVTVMVPQPGGGATVETLRPGQSVPGGAVTPTQYGSAQVPTAATRTMAETAPKVLELATRVGQLVDQQVKTLGPGASRWNEFMAGTVGAPNPEFTKLRTDVGLLQTALMRMHVGARGGEQMMEHFRGLIDVSKQSPENLKAALEEISEYAKAVEGEGKIGGGGGGSTAAAAPTHFVDGSNQWDIPADKVDAFKKTHPNAKAQ